MKPFTQPPKGLFTHHQVEARPGDDLREPQFRYDTFRKLVAFQDKTLGRPGCVYFVLPELAALFPHDKPWVAFLNGFTQNPVTTYRILREAPTSNHAMNALSYWKCNYEKLAVDTDRFRFKHKFAETVESYLKAQRSAPYDGTFGELWDWATTNLYAFGRLTAWSYLEYVRILGLTKVDPPSLMLRDISGSKSHRNGLCKLLGMDWLDDHKSNPLGEVTYSEFDLGRLEEAEHWLVEELECLRFTLESDLCLYKSMWRPNRRYPNVYADMMHDRIRYSEEKFGDALPWFWQTRELYLPSHLRKECRPGFNAIGLDPRIQNMFRLTGQTPNL